MSASLDWSASAELYSSVATFKSRNSRYQRFPSAAEAIRFAIEEMPRATLRSVALECGDERYEGEAIRELYHAPDYPLQRGKR
ncbi:hypothetical protein O9Z70_10020 [Devosia sp. YIM 151766]|uniref:hypothetical protein n=1 Tax=Devosia sp. YIM 151766 TaxID=3017325 RepID=UPI00255C64FC|nr:hypothetical protein [Devosia sp. YIM 151766]WIY51821.1 hypothetical protein O9Z70_10020 [Devosia sp. YIM 151766]